MGGAAISEATRGGWIIATATVSTERVAER
jgi:hypothetical protein